MDNPIKGNDMVVKLINDIVSYVTNDNDPLTDKEINELANQVLDNITIDGVVDKRKESYLNDIIDIIYAAKLKET